MNFIKDSIVSERFVETTDGFKIVKTFKSGKTITTYYNEPKPDSIDTGLLKALTGSDGFAVAFASKKRRSAFMLGPFQ
jgi:hypothetical protein